MARPARVAARALTQPVALLTGAIAAFAGGFGAIAVLQHHAFETGRFDVGNIVQAVWATAHGDVLEVTDLAGRQISRLGAHFDPIVAALVPLWLAWPDPGVLLLFQAVAVALGAVPVFRLARRRLASPHAGLGFALAYLLYPPTQWLVLDDFHPVALATPLLLAAWDMLDEGRLTWFALAAGAACLSKEHIGLVVAGMGIWYALAARKWRVGAAITAAGTAAAVFATMVVVPHFAPGGGSPFSDRYRALGGSPAGIVETALTRPDAIVSEAGESRDLRYLLDLVVPLAGLPLAAPEVALVALPELAANVLSSTATQTSVHFHYTAGAIPVLFVAAIAGAARVRRRIAVEASTLARVVVAAALLSGVVYGPLPLWSRVPLGEDLAARDHVVTQHDRVARRAVAIIPEGVAVSATNTLGAHLSERSRVLSFPLLQGANWLAVDTTRLSYLDAAIGGTRAERALARLRTSGAWQIVLAEDGVLVLRRK